MVSSVNHSGRVSCAPRSCIPSAVCRSWEMGCYQWSMKLFRLRRPEFYRDINLKHDVLLRNPGKRSLSSGSTMLINYRVWLSPLPSLFLSLSLSLSLDFMLRSGPDSLCAIIHILSFSLANKHTVIILFSFPSPAASLSGLWGLAQTQSWLLYKRVSGGHGAAGEGGEDAESQATGKNGLIRAAQHLRPQSDTAVLLRGSLSSISVVSHPASSSPQSSPTLFPSSSLAHSCLSHQLISLKL